MYGKEEWGIQGFSLGIGGKEATCGAYRVLAWESEGKRALMGYTVF